MSDVSSSEGLDYVAVPGIPEAETQRFLAQALSIVETIGTAWRETVTFPQLAMSFLLASNTFPDRIAFERFAAGSKYWDPQKTIFQIQWVPRVPNEERNGTRSPNLLFTANLPAFAHAAHLTHLHNLYSICPTSLQALSRSSRARSVCSPASTPSAPPVACLGRPTGARSTSPSLTARLQTTSSSASISTTTSRSCLRADGQTVRNRN